MCSCIELNETTRGREDRVKEIAKQKPECCCELEPFSRFSPGLVTPSETVSRVVCSPMHVSEKKLELKTSFFSHISVKGASIQREDIAEDQEFVNCVSTIVNGNAKAAWLAVVSAKVEDIRELMKTDGKQQLGVLDAGLENNPAHAEIHAAFPHADLMELRVNLRDLFCRNGIVLGSNFRDGRVWAALDPQLKVRSVPQAWQTHRDQSKSDHA